VCQQVAAIPAKRVPPPETFFLEREEVQALLARMPSKGRLALRDRALLLFLYNTGARVQEAAGLRAGHLDLGEHPLARLHANAARWSACPRSPQPAPALTELLAPHAPPPGPQSAVYTATGQPLTRSGIYKIVRRQACGFDDPRTGRKITPHTFRHTTAVHL